MEEAIEQAALIGQLFHHALWIAYLSETYLLAGRMDDAVQLAGHALDLCCERKERGRQAWALRLLGEIYAHHDPPEVERAEDDYQQAMTLAVELGMGPLQAHCHLGLGMLSARLGRREQARTELSTAIELYRTMDMTFWPDRAEAALAALPQADTAHKIPL